MRPLTEKDSHLNQYSLCMKSSCWVRRAATCHALVKTSKQAGLKKTNHFIPHGCISSLCEDHEELSRSIGTPYVCERFMNGDCTRLEIQSSGVSACWMLDRVIRKTSKVVRVQIRSCRRRFGDAGDKPTSNWVERIETWDCLEF